MEESVVVVASYKQRGDHNLERILGQLNGLSPAIVVVNDDSADCVSVRSHGDTSVLTRPNTGMNIGAWSEAIPYVAEYKTVIFIQDECFVQDSAFLSAYAQRLAMTGVGMIGESLNPKWDCSWKAIARSRVNYSFQDEGGSHVTRVDYYRRKMVEWRIDPGESAKHLRALVWAFSRESLAAVGSFPIGGTKEESIAAEIAVAKKVEQLGFSVEQVASEHFKYFGHVEWRKDGSSKA